MINTRRLLNSLAGVSVAAMVVASAGAFAAATYTGTTSGASTDSSASVGAAISDTAITAKVKAKFSTDSRLKGSDISVETNNGVVTLNGTAVSSTAKGVAEDLAKNVGGVNSVNNQIAAPSAVDGLGAKAKHAAHETVVAVSDSTVTAKLKAKYGTDSKAKGSDIDVTTSNGIVALSGTVVSESQKMHAVYVARHTSGVKQVDTTALKVAAP